MSPTALKLILHIEKTKVITMLRHDRHLNDLQSCVDKLDELIDKYDLTKRKRY